MKTKLITLTIAAATFSLTSCTTPSSLTATQQDAAVGAGIGAAAGAIIGNQSDHTAEGAILGGLLGGGSGYLVGQSKENARN